MSKRALTVWRDFEDDVCGECEDVGGGRTADAFCRLFDVDLVPLRLSFKRCEKCLAAESPALKQAGHDRAARAELPTMPDVRDA